MSNDTIHPAGAGTETLPASTPEYAPVTQTVVEDAREGETHTANVETPPAVSLPDNSPYLAPREPEPQETPETPNMPITPNVPASPPDAPLATPDAPIPPAPPAHPPTNAPEHAPLTSTPPVSYANSATPPIASNYAPAGTAAPPAASPEKRVYDLLLEEFSRDPRFELHTNVRALLDEVQAIKAMPQTANASAAVTDDLAAIRETVEKIWTHLEGEKGTEEEKRRKGEEETQSTIHNSQSTIENRQSAIVTPELIAETRALVRSVNEEVNATRNSVIQLTNQGRMMLDVTTRCLREMDKTARKYAQQEQSGETNPLLDELRSLRDMLADGFENARLEPIAPEPGETFRYSDHRADNGSTSSGKIKRTVFPGFRWTQPNPPVVLMPAVVETE